MNIKWQEKEQIKRLIEEKLKNADFDTRIHIDKDLLNDLFFNTYTETLRETGEKKEVKYFAWFDRETLKKIDLSELSTENVMWDLNYKFRKLFVKSEDHYRNNLGVVDRSVDLTGMNIKPDFQKGFRDGNGTLTIDSIIFDFIDLSDVKLPSRTKIVNSSFDNTGLKIDLDSFEKLAISNSSFYNADFSACTLEPAMFDQKSDKHIVNSCLSYTKVHIVLPDFTNPMPTTDRIEELRKRESLSEIEDRILCALERELETIKRNNKLRKEIVSLIHRGCLRGCYVNNHVIHDRAEKLKLCTKHVLAYEAYVENLTNSISQDIDKQLQLQQKK